MRFCRRRHGATFQFVHRNDFISISLVGATAARRALLAFYADYAVRRAVSAVIAASSRISYYSAATAPRPLTFPRRFLSEPWTASRLCHGQTRTRQIYAPRPEVPSRCLARWRAGCDALKSQPTACFKFSWPRPLFLARLTFPRKFDKDDSREYFPPSRRRSMTGSCDTRDTALCDHSSWSPRSTMQRFAPMTMPMAQDAHRRDGATEYSDGVHSFQVAASF